MNPSSLRDTIYTLLLAIFIGSLALRWLTGIRLLNKPILWSLVCIIICYIIPGCPIPPPTPTPISHTYIPTPTPISHPYIPTPTATPITPAPSSTAYTYIDKRQNENARYWLEDERTIWDFQSVIPGSEWHPIYKAIRKEDAGRGNARISLGESVGKFSILNSSEVVLKSTSAGSAEFGKIVIKESGKKLEIHFEGRDKPFILVPVRISP